MRSLTVLLEKPLRVCLDCGLEAWTEADLGKFKKQKRGKYGHRNLCKECHNERDRKTYFNGRHITSKKWRENNYDKVKEYHRRSNKYVINFMDKIVYLGYNPRTNICSECGRRYPEELKQQTALHHYNYDIYNPLAYTIELCGSCHTRLHAKIRKGLRKYNEKRKILATFPKQ